jgi:predicted acetyltransferase
VSVESEFAFYDPGSLVDDDLELVLEKTTPGNSASGYAPTYVFQMRRVGRDIQIGNIKLRAGNIPYLVMYGGHIGYGVEPAYRGHRYASRACRLLLPLARKHGLNPLWITCNPDNIASRKTCERLGAEFVEIVEVPEDTDMYRHGVRKKCRYRLIL